jgi:hypothetical protein
VGLGRQSRRLDGRRGRRNKINGRVLIYRDLAPPPLFAGAEIHCSKMSFVLFLFFFFFPPFFFVGVQQNLSLNRTHGFLHAN